MALQVSFRVTAKNILLLPLQTVNTVINVSWRLNNENIRLLFQNPIIHLLINSKKTRKKLQWHTQQPEQAALC